MWASRGRKSPGEDGDYRPRLARYCRRAGDYRPRLALAASVTEAAESAAKSARPPRASMSWWWYPCPSRWCRPCRPAGAWVDRRRIQRIRQADPEQGVRSGWEHRAVDDEACRIETVAQSDRGTDRVAVLAGQSHHEIDIRVEKLHLHGDARVRDAGIDRHHELVRLNQARLEIAHAHRVRWRHRVGHDGLQNDGRVAEVDPQQIISRRVATGESGIGSDRDIVRGVGDRVGDLEDVTTDGIVTEDLGSYRVAVGIVHGEVRVQRCPCQGRP